MSILREEIEDFKLLKHIKLPVADSNSCMAEQIYCCFPCMMSAEAMVQFLLMYFFTYYNTNKGKHWNPLEFPQMGIPMDSDTFQWIPMETIPGGSWIPTDSTGFCRILLEIPWNGKPKWLRLQPNGFCWNSMEF